MRAKVLLLLLRRGADAIALPPGERNWHRR